MSVADNLKIIEKQIINAAKNCNRRPEDIHLVAVSKNQSQEKIQEAVDAGHCLFGENRVQEAKKRWQNLKEKNLDLRLHLIGPLQTNKVREAVALFDVIETVDRAKLAEVLAEEMKKQNRRLPCFIQVNTGEESQKGGVLPAELPALIKTCCDLKLEIKGLMCIPPVDEPPALHFAFLAKLARQYNLCELSMGMSADFEKAIPLGATYVRIGTAVFGARDKQD